MPGDKKRLKTILYGAALVGAVALLITAPRDSGQPISAKRPTVHAKEKRPTAAPQGSAAAVVAGLPGAKDVPPAQSALPNPAAPAAPNARAATRRNLFQPLVAKTDPRAAALSLAPWPADLGVLPLPGGEQPDAKRQRNNWDYVGTVKLNGMAYALIEEKKTKQGVYLRNGDIYRGGRVQSISTERLVIAMAGKQYVLPKSTGEEESGRGSSGGAASAAPVVPAPGQPGAPGALPAPPGVPGAPGVTDPAQAYAGNPGGDDARAQRRQRRMEWMRRHGEGGQ